MWTRYPLAPALLAVHDERLYLAIGRPSDRQPHVGGGRHAPASADSLQTAANYRRPEFMAVYRRVLWPSWESGRPRQVPAKARRRALHGGWLQSDRKLPRKAHADGAAHRAKGLVGGGERLGCPIRPEAACNGKDQSRDHPHAFHHAAPTQPELMPRRRCRAALPSPVPPPYGH